MTETAASKRPVAAIVAWADFLRSQAEAILAMDFIETVALISQRHYILAAILCRSKSHRCWSGGMSVLGDESVQDVGAERPVGVEVGSRSGVLLGIGW